MATSDTVPHHLLSLELEANEPDGTPAPGSGGVSLFASGDTGSFTARFDTGKKAAVSTSEVTLDTQRIVFAAAAPAITDAGGLGSLWVNTTAGAVAVYVLAAVSAGSYTWKELAEAVS